MTNQEFLARAAATTADLAAAGKLNPEQAEKFVHYVIDLSILKDIVRIVPVKGEKFEIDKIGVHRRVAMAAKEAVAPLRRRGVSHSKVPITPSDMIVPFEISDKYKRFNIEGADVEDTVIQMMAAQYANDMDELALDGNTIGPARIQEDIFEGGSTTQYIKDEYMALQNGFLKLAEGGQTVDAANAVLDAEVFNDAILAMPVKYRKNKALLKWLISPDHEQGYRKEYGSRQTAGADVAINSDVNLKPFGTEMLGVPMLERSPFYVENTVANTNGTSLTALSFKPITELVLTATDIDGENPITPYVLATDYTEDLTNGTWIRLGGGVIPSGGTIKATYRTAGRMLLCNPQNLIIGVGLEIAIEKDRNIWSRMNEFAIHGSLGTAVENADAIVLVTNIKDPAA